MTSPSNHQHNIQLLWKKLEDVPAEYHGTVAWYLLGSISCEMDREDWNNEIENAIRYARGIERI